MKRILWHCVTGIDGETVDPARLYGMFAVATFLFLAFYSVVFNHAAWNAQDYGIGFGALLVGFGASVAVKAKTEPQATETQE